MNLPHAQPTGTIPGPAKPVSIPHLDSKLSLWSMQACTASVLTMVTVCGMQNIRDLWQSLVAANTSTNAAQLTVSCDEFVKMVAEAFHIPIHDPVIKQLFLAFTSYGSVQEKVQLRYSTCSARSYPGVSCCCPASSRNTRLVVIS